jgi:chromosome segregation protein
MKLQQIKLSGFKSFVDSTAIEVHGQLVGIVGPNGCGKSNVIDAVRWVLGESSAKQLRGDSMLDVIFNGSIKRKAVSRATVELIFDNSAKSLYGLWNTYDEVSIKRLISRQGESNYYINNQQVRRKDINELFLGTGVGTKGYAVIEQGMISRIIESKPEDMRLYIEEAAGVSKYREKRKETLQRLSDTAENLQRLEDIHSEIIKQLSTLKEQAQVAELHQRLNQELNTKQTLVMAIKVHDANKILAEANQFIQHCEDELRVLGYQLEEVNQNLTVEQDKKTIQEQRLQDLMQQFNELRTALARVEERYKHYSDLLKRFENESTDLAAKEQEITHEIEELAIQSENIAEKIADNQFEISEQTLCREEQQQLVETQQEKYNQIAEQVSNRQSGSAKLKHELDLLQNNLRHKHQQKTNLSTRLARLLEEGNTLDFDQNYHFIKEEIELVAEDLLINESSLEQKSQQAEQYKQQVENLQRELNQQQQLLAGSNAKIATLNDLLSSKNDADNSDTLFTKVVSELWQALEVEAGYERVLEVALGNLLQSKVLADLTELNTTPKQALNIWLSSSQAIAIQAGSLSECLKLRDENLQGVFGYLNNYCLLDDIGQHRKLASGQYGVTRDGHLASRDFIRYHANSDGHSLLQYQQQLQQEESEQLRLSDVSDELQAKLTAQQQFQQQLHNDIISLDAKHKRLLVKKHDLQLEFTKQEQIYVQNKRHQERVAQESELLTHEISHLDLEIQELELQIEDKHLAHEELDLAAQDIEMERLEHETALQLAKNKLQDLDNKINRYIIDNQLLQQQKLNAQNLSEEKKLYLAAAAQKLAELTHERQSFNSSDQAQEIMQLQQQIAEIAAQMQETQQGLDQLSNKIIGLKNQASSLNSNYQRNLEKINQTKFKQQEQQILLSTYQENLAKLELTIPELEEMLTQNQQSLSALSSACRELEQQIAALGLVNLKAIEDLTNASTKEQELFSQIEDLQTATATLRDAIEHIDGETRTLLQSTFEKLNQAIVVYFRTLFGGGDARLALTDKDILIAGVQIFAEPPGKKNSTIHLLSGGEKALAAMSFIFALFSLNPAPFCLLDEVDAPLDDANTQRFCNLVQELSSKTQFVYISHNRLAMEMADQLVGVTMQEKGVSTVVSVSLIDAVKHAVDVAAPAV